MAALRVLAADDHPAMLQGIRATLEQAEDIEVVAEASTGTQVLQLIELTDPDVVLLDIRMPELDGFACLDEIRRRYPRVKVVMISLFADEEHVRLAFARGASGYVVKNINPLDLPSAVRQAVEGSFYLPFDSRESNEQALARAAGLTKRELVILKAVARGLSNRAIARELWVTDHTVKIHLSNIYRKLGIANRTEAIRYAYEHGIAEEPINLAKEPSERT